MRSLWPIINPDPVRAADRDGDGPSHSHWVTAGTSRGGWCPHCGSPVVYIDHWVYAASLGRKFRLCCYNCGFDEYFPKAQM